MGDDPVQFEILSDQSENFMTETACVNYEDPNLNIKIPVFSIHGNHDDPGGLGSLCALDLLQASGLVNYFGKQVEVDDINMKPILMRKGETLLALYGLGNIRDERLHRSYEQKKAKFFRPSENADSWFNLFVLHQNRAKHTTKGHIPEHFIDEFIDLVLWGHEHECRIEPENSERTGVPITQPGSSIATSLSEGEAAEKYLLLIRHVGILHINRSRYKIDKIKLNTVRPLIMDSIVLSKVVGLQKDRESVHSHLCLKVDEMISEAKVKWESANPGEGANNCPLPLIRLRVDYSDGFNTPAPTSFGKAYIGLVANPKELLLYHRKRAVTSTSI